MTINRLLLIIFLMLLLFISSFFILSLQSNDYLAWRTHTRAICKGNICQDMLITCLDARVNSMVPISGMVVFEDNWKDRRQILSNYC